MDDRDVFLRAIDVLQERGWHQGNYAAAWTHGEPDPGSPVCVIGALNLAAGHPVFYHQGHTLAWEAGLDPDWNDDPSRTYEDVVSALKRAAYDCDTGEDFR